MTLHTSRYRCAGVGGEGQGSIVEEAVKNDDGANAWEPHIDTNTTVDDGEVLIDPSPVPHLLNGSATVNESQISHSKLLVAKLSTNQAAIEGHIPHVAATAAFHINTDMIVSRGLRKFEYDILD